MTCLIFTEWTLTEKAITEREVNMKGKTIAVLGAIGALWVGAFYALSLTGDDKAAKKPDAKGNPVSAKSMKPADKFAFLPKIIAKVGDKEITKEEFIKDITAMSAQRGMPLQMLPPQLIQAIAPQMVSQMVNKLVLLEAAVRAGFKPSPQLVKDDFDEMIKTVPPKKLDKFKAELKKENKTLANYREEISKDKNAQIEMAVDNWIKEKIIPSIKVTDKEVQDFYDKNPEMFKTAEVSHILIQPKDRTPKSKEEAQKKAQDLLKKLTKGEIKFGETAEKESACKSGKEAKGSLGVVKRNQMVPEFEKVAFATPDGKLSPVVETRFGYHIIKGGKKSKTPFLEVKAKLHEFLVQREVQKQLQKIVKHAESSGRIKIFLKPPKNNRMMMRMPPAPVKK